MAQNKDQPVQHFVVNPALYRSAIQTLATLPYNQVGHLLNSLQATTVPVYDDPTSIDNQSGDE